MTLASLLSQLLNRLVLFANGPSRSGPVSDFSLREREENQVPHREVSGNKERL